MNDPKNLEPKANETSASAEGTESDGVVRSKLPDFRPLGTVRDYFTELMRQDSIR
ncbi:hypothetical protein [Vampirovibrio chlorellavorus]|uniref:hypothetical protein n=1 Tax=Vampirovibrio chlorellavorus TaxID=758823 RepID=UPI0026EF1184|nr:hypothetical protein [Vampirovibrio chlorellavorus]